MLDRKWLILILATFTRSLGTLDLYSMTFALPFIEKNLHFAHHRVIWVLNIFLLAFVTSLLIGGKLIKKRGARSLLNLGLSIFSIGVIICALTPSAWLMLVGRAIAGIGCGLITPTGQLMANNVFEKKERAIGAGIGSALFNLFIIIGPLAVAIIAQYLNWRLFFWLALPVIALCFIANFYLTEHQEKQSAPYPYLGTALFTSSIFFLIFAIMEGNNFGWSSFWILGSFLLFLICLISYILCSWQATTILIDPHFFQNRAFTLLLSMRFFFRLARCIIVLWILYFVKDLHYAPLAVSILFLCARVPSLISSVISGFLARQFGYRIALRIGLCGSLLGAIWVACFYQFNSIYIFLPGILILLFFSLLIIAPSAAITLSILPTPFRATGSGILLLMTYLPMTIGIALYSTIFHAMTNPTLGFFVITLIATLFILIAICISFTIKTSHEETIRE